MSMFEYEVAHDRMKGFGVSKALSVKYADPMRDGKASGSAEALRHEYAHPLFGRPLFVNLIRR